MGYVTIKESTNDKLILTREPGIYAWSILLGAVTFGLGAAYYGSDYIIWKIMYVSGAVYIGISCMDEWEICELNKETKEIRLKRTSMLQKLLPFYFEQHTVVSNLDEIVDVRIEEQDVKYFGKSYQVALVLSSGISLGVTDAFTFGNDSDHKQIAEKIKKFLDLENRPVYPKSENDIDILGQGDDVDDDSEDSFEQIDPSEVTTEEENDSLPL
ncbi:hypothetical protein LOTGIDRAFT_204604 [Lottia gigantea]|uniref:Essential for reactive oxygen species protein n=1 Tax=Lottia gigantea TaxID=225164 RepID=V3ZN91_LOTGI|nr:hypothetical protein LOTGIDRAFT_204604 [Lottia gigantea]ESO85797.1 hypothetical protein LOTGIDRAFT_204604 [Lottia gigantea]